MNIRDAILILTKSQPELRQRLAEYLGVAVRDITDWESGKAVPSNEISQAIAEKYNMALNESLWEHSDFSGEFNEKLNADRFLGFADVYEENRPAVPSKACDIIINYLEKAPETVVDLGCGTGLSTLAWKNKCRNVIGIEPSKDMLQAAKNKSDESVSFKQAYADNTGLPGAFADIAVCSQSFHWMNPKSTLAEINRILKPGGVFAAIDYDWPPISDWRAEYAYSDLLKSVRKIEQNEPVISNTCHKWKKDLHLKNIKESGYFRYWREIVFENKERCTAKRLIGMALSQGSVQTILKVHSEMIENEIKKYEKAINNIFAKEEFDILFCYRMRIGKK